ncbi:MAG: N-acetyltransferase [Dehalococcoidia bacterium]|nr:MAG: N-acetyltransferase [Dehalococcoidia bacterium]
MAWIAGERIVLRAWERDDVRALWDAAQTLDDTGQRMRDWLEPPKSLAQLEQEFDGNVSEPDPTVVRLIIEAEGRAIGDIDLFHIDQRSRNAVVGLGIWREEDRGRGFGTDALRTMLRWAFRHLNVHRIELSVEPDNERAVRVYEKLGFVREGMRREHHYDDGCFRDELIMGLLGREFEATDRELTRAAVRTTP